MNNINCFSLSKSDIQNIFIDAIKEKENKNLLVNKNTIVLAMANCDVEKYLDIKNFKYNLIICTPNSLDPIILNKAFDANIEIILTPYTLPFETVIDMASDMVLEMNNAYFLDLFKDNEYIKACYNYSKNNKDIFKEYNIFIIPSNMYSLALGMYRYYNVLTDALIYIYKDRLIDFDELSYIDDLNEFIKNCSNDKRILLFN